MYKNKRLRNLLEVLLLNFWRTWGSILPFSCFYYICKLVTISCYAINVTIQYCNVMKHLVFSVSINLFRTYLSWILWVYKYFWSINNFKFNKELFLSSQNQTLKMICIIINSKSKVSLLSMLPWIITTAI